MELYKQEKEFLILFLTRNRFMILSFYLNLVFCFANPKIYSKHLDDSMLFHNITLFEDQENSFRGCNKDDDCQDLITPKCDITKSVGLCVSCLDSADCASFGKFACVSGACKECENDRHCSFSSSLTFCNSETYTCEPCIKDENCAHSITKKFCSVSRECKELKAVFPSTRKKILPEEFNKFRVVVHSFYEKDRDSLEFTWRISDDRITINSLSLNELELNPFGHLNPLPSILEVTYFISNFYNSTDEVSESFEVSQPFDSPNFTVEPKVGREFETIFSLNVEVTVQNTSSLFYKFCYVLDQWNSCVPLTDFQRVPFLAIYLPSGNQQDHHLFIKVVISNNFRTLKEIGTFVKVVPSKKKLSEIMTLFQKNWTPFSETLFSKSVLQSHYVWNYESQIWNHSSQLLRNSSKKGFLKSSYPNKAFPQEGVEYQGYEDYDNLIIFKISILSDLENLIPTFESSEAKQEQLFSILQSLTSSLQFMTEELLIKSIKLFHIILEMVQIDSQSNHFQSAAQIIENFINYHAYLDVSNKPKILVEPLLQKLSALYFSNSLKESSLLRETGSWIICLLQETSHFEQAFSLCNISKDFSFPDTISIPQDPFNLMLITTKKPWTSRNLFFLPQHDSKFGNSYHIPTFILTSDKRLRNCDSSKEETLFERTTPEIVFKTSRSLQTNQVDSFFSDSNIFKLGEISALKDFPILKSPLFYMVLGLTIIMIVVSYWSVKKDRQLDRDFLKMPHKSPSQFYRIFVYISICHTFFGIFTLFDKDRPRIMRSVLFYTKMLGVMALSTIFNQTKAELNQIQKIAISLVTLGVITPINLSLGYLVFKRNLEPKVRRKRLVLQKRKAQISVENKEEESRKEERRKQLTKCLNVVGYGLVISIILGYNYIIFVITAVNSKSDENVVEKWLLGFLQSIAIDFCGVQIIKTMIHLGIISTLQNENKKKFLCIPRRFLPKLLNANIFDYKKRFAALDSLYSKKGKYNVEIASPEAESPSSVRPGINTVTKSILKQPSYSTNSLTHGVTIDSQIHSSIGTERIEPFPKSDTSRMDSSQLQIEDPSVMDSMELSLREKKRARTLAISKLQRNRRLLTGITGNTKIPN